MKYREYLLNTHLYMFYDIIICKMYRHYVNKKSIFQTSEKGSFSLFVLVFSKKSGISEKNQNLLVMKIYFLKK